MEQQEAAPQGDAQQLASAMVQMMAELKDQNQRMMAQGQALLGELAAMKATPTNTTPSTSTSPRGYFDAATNPRNTHSACPDDEEDDFAGPPMF
jgi:hypothetical protein